MNTKYLKIVLLFSILALSIHCQSVAPTVTNFWNGITGQVNPHSSTYNRATNTYIIAHAGPTGNELVSYNVEGDKLVQRSVTKIDPLYDLVSNRDDERVAMITSTGQINVISSKNNWATFKTLWTSFDNGAHYANSLIAWFEGTDYLFVGLPTGKVCSMLVRPGARQQLCRDVTIARQFAFIGRKLKSNMTYFLPIDHNVVYLQDFADPSKGNYQISLKLPTRFFTVDRVTPDFFFVVHNSDNIVSYYQYEDKAEYSQSKDLELPELLLIDSIRNTGLILFVCRLKAVILRGEGLEELTRFDFKAPGLADPQTWSIGESNGYVSIFQRAIEPQSRWWSWQIAVVTSDVTKVTRAAAAGHNLAKRSLQNHRAKKSQLKKGKLLVHLLAKKSAKSSK
jgi:hypothetical protein